jgi:hypothetical protein
MKLSERRREIAEQVDQRVQESIDRKGFGSGIFKPDAQFKQWRDKSSEEAHEIDIIPYIVGDNPTNPKIRKGDISYSAEYWTHSGIGPNEDRVICLAKSFNKPCPVCEDRKALADDVGYDDEHVKKMKPSRQVLYNVVVYDTADEEKKGVQVWMVPHWFFERFIDDIAKASRGRGRVPFADPDVGKSIMFYRRGKNEVTYSGHQFKDRDYKISDEILDSVYCLEDLVHIPTYAEVYELHFNKKPGGGEVAAKEAEGDDPPVSSRRPRSEQKAEEEKAGCKGGGTFGKDIDNLDHCNKCNDYDDCCKEAERLEAANKPQQDPNPPAQGEPPQQISSRRRQSA